MLGHETARIRARFTRARWPVALLVLLLSIAVWVWFRRAETRAVSQLPRAERRAVYARQLENLRVLCARPRDDILSERCRQQAEFILAFPECDTACQEIANRILQQPTR
jgi:cytochrome b pre-mRNA-processing protein 3